MAIAQEIVYIVQSAMKEHPEQTCLVIHVQIGELIAVVPDSLQFAYKAIIKDTVLESTALKMHVIPVQAECQDCRHVFGMDTFESRCPKCLSVHIKVTQGNEFHVHNLEIQ